MDQSDPEPETEARRESLVASRAAADASDASQKTYSPAGSSPPDVSAAEAAAEVAALRTQVKELQSALRLRDGDARRSLSRAEAERAAETESLRAELSALRDRLKRARAETVERRNGESDARDEGTAKPSEEASEARVRAAESRAAAAEAEAHAARDRLARGGAPRRRRRRVRAFRLASLHLRGGASVRAGHGAARRARGGERARRAARGRAERASK